MDAFPVRLPHLCFLPTCLCVAGVLRAASFDDRVEALFRPPLGEVMALSPDGQRVAYTRQAGRNLTIVMMSLDQPGPRRTVFVDPNREAFAQAPAQLRFLRWATPSRLVFAPTERVVPLPPVADKNGRLGPNPDGPTIVSPILAVDADGKQHGTLVDARDFMETPAEARRTLADFLRTTKELQATRNEPVHWRMPHLDVLGFLPREREQMVIQTRGGYGIPAQHLIDIRTGSVREFGGDWPLPPGQPQVFDWYRLKTVGEHQEAVHPLTTWRDEEFGRVQRELEAKFPRRIVEILDWSETRLRVLFRVTGGSDPGRVFVYQRPEDLVVEFLRRAPWLNATRLNATQFFEFAAADGAPLSGYVTWPRKPRLTPPPLLVVFACGFPGHGQPAGDPEAQVFADLGFVVARLNHRCAGGVRAQDLGALRAAVDRVSVNDAVAAIEWLAARNPQRPFDRKRVATIGRGFGGYLAVRALQLQPAVFRCGIAIDAPMELRSWLRASNGVGLPEPTVAPKPVGDVPAALIDHAGADWQKLSVLEQVDALTQPLLLLVEPKRNAVIDAATGELRARLQRAGRAPEQVELDPGFAAAQPKARAATYRKIEEFLNVNLQGYAVKIGAAKEVE